MSIEAIHVTKTFGNYIALNDVSLRVDDGELVALLGPSGSGKTTLMRIIAGLEQPDDDGRGEIHFHGEDVADRRIGERNVGFVFQHYALFKHMSVFENIAFGLRVRPRRLRPSKLEIHDKVMRLLKLIQLDGLGNRYPSQLSGGQRQRVALARALAVEPRVLLLDEPFGALDARVRKDLRDWLRRLHDELRMTTVLVTHDQEEALEVADRVVVMNQSKIEQVGSPSEVFHHPASQFVMSFLGHVNVFQGRFAKGRPEFDAVGGHDATMLFVRPHELSIQRELNGIPSIAAVVSRIHHAGAMAKVFLEVEDGEPIQVELSLDQFDELALVLGETVFVSAKKARVFAADYAI